MTPQPLTPERLRLVDEAVLDASVRRHIGSLTPEQMAEQDRNDEERLAALADDVDDGDQ